MVQRSGECRTDLARRLRAVPNSSGWDPLQTWTVCPTFRTALLIPDFRAFRRIRQSPERYLRQARGGRLASLGIIAVIIRISPTRMSFCTPAERGIGEAT